MATARARHILVEDKEKALQLKGAIEEGQDFEEAARQHSECPSGRRGGDLGEFRKGQMVPEFDQVVFNEQVGELHGPVETQFGWHLIEVLSRGE